MQSSLTIMGYALPPTDARKYIHVRRMQPSLAIMGYSLPPTDATSFRPPRSTKLYVTFYLIYISFHEQFPFDKPSCDELESEFSRLDFTHYLPAFFSTPVLCYIHLDTEVNHISSCTDSRF